MPKKVTVLLPFLLAYACSPQKIPVQSTPVQSRQVLPTYSSQIVNIPQTEEGTIYLQCTGAGTDKTAAYENAIYNAFSAVLFVGVPASVQSRPMIDPATADKVRAKIDNCLKDNNCYRNYIAQISPPDENVSAIENGYASNPKIKINLRALRTYLEQNGIIPKAFTF